MQLNKEELQTALVAYESLSKEVADLRVQLARKQDALVASENKFYAKEREMNDKLYEQSIKHNQETKKLKDEHEAALLKLQPRKTGKKK